MSVAKNIIASWSNIFLSIVSVFLLYPMLTKTLGEEQYGIWIYISSVTGYFYFMQLGVPLANVKFVSKYHASNEPDKVNEVLSSNLFFFSIIAIIAAIAGIIFSLFIDNAFKMSDVYIKSAKIAMVVATLTVSLSFILSTFEGILHALQDFVFLNVVKNIIVVIKLVTIYYCITSDNGIVILSIIMLAITVIQGIATYLIAKYKYKTLKLSVRSINIGMFKEITKFSSFVMLLQIAGTISFETDAMVIGSLISVSSIIYFSIANSILLYFMTFIIGISSVLMPKMSALDAVGDKSAITAAYVKYSRLTFIIVAPICFYLIISGGDFIALWMGEKFRVVTGNVLTILTISYFFFLVQRGVAYPIFMGTSKMRFLSTLMIATAVANLLLSIWWGLEFGIYGVAWGTTIPNLISVIGIIWFMNKNYDVSILSYIRKSFLIPFIAAGISALFLMISKRIIPQENYLNIFIVIFVSSLVYAVIIKFSCFPKGLKEALNASD